MFHSHLLFITICIRRTSGLSLRTFKQSAFGHQEVLGRKVIHILSVFKALLTVNTVKCAHYAIFATGELRTFLAISSTTDFINGISTSLLHYSVRKLFDLQFDSAVWVQDII